MKQRGIARVYLLIVLVIMGVGGYYYFSKSSSTPVVPKPTPSVTQQSTQAVNETAISKTDFDAQIINIIASKMNINPANIKIGTPRTENVGWIAVNAGVTGSAAIYIFQKNGTELELVYYGQECPSKELIIAKKIPSEILIAINSSGCK